MKYFAFGLTIETSLDFTQTLSISEAATDVLVWECEATEKAARLAALHRRGIYAKVGKTDEAFIIDWPTIAKFRVSNGTEVRYQKHLGVDEGSLKLFLMSEVMGIILFQRGFHILHGSAVRINKSGIVFLGAAGAGKSTTAAAFAKAGYTVLADDMVVLKFSEKTIHVIPSFGEFKVWQKSLSGLGIKSDLPSFDGSDKFLIRQDPSLFPTSPVPISAINILLKPYSSKKEGVVSDAQLPFELLRYFPISKYLLTKEYLRNQFWESFQLKNSVDIRFTKRPKNFETLENYVMKVCHLFNQSLLITK